jgi:hypothetical protein
VAAVLEILPQPGAYGKPQIWIQRNIAAVEKLVDVGTQQQAVTDLMPPTLAESLDVSEGVKQSVAR